MSCEEYYVLGGMNEPPDSRESTARSATNHARPFVGLNLVRDSTQRTTAVFPE